MKYQRSLETKRLEIKLLKLNQRIRELSLAIYEDKQKLHRLEHKRKLLRDEIELSDDLDRVTSSKANRALKREF